MNDKKSLDALLRFLDYLKDKGLLKANTAASRKATASKVLSCLSPEELEDVSALDLDDVMSRFHNLEGQKYTPDSINTYKSRLKSTLEDFGSYLDNPMGFRPAVQSRSRSVRSAQDSEKAARPQENPKQDEAPSTKYAAPPDTMIIPIPIRADLVVRVQGIPHDLTVQEASKIAAVIQALANSQSEF